MPNWLLDGLADVGYALDTPGAYLRGALTGNAGQRASGEDLLASYGVQGGPLGGLAAEMVVDPLTLLPPVYGAYKGVQALRGAGDMAPAMRRLGELGDATAMDRRLGELGRQVDPLDRLRYDYQGTTGAGNPLADALGDFAGDESGALSLPFLPDEVLAATGRRATHIGHEDALSAYRPWVGGLSPEELGSLGQYTSGKQELVSNVLRGGSESSGGHPINPWEYMSPGLARPGQFPLARPEDVTSEVVPYLDSALSRGESPRDLLTYRSARRLGELDPRSAEGLVGSTVSDPSYLSTTIDPYGQFYGRTFDPGHLALDIAVPQGGPSGYAGAVSRWDNEKELLLPRDAAMRVAAVRKVPVEKLDYQWHRLDPEGKPMPIPGHLGSSLFDEDVVQENLSGLLRDGAYGDTVIPDSWMAPDWRDVRERQLQSSGEQTGALLEMLGNGMAPHAPATRRRTAAEMAAALGPLLGRIKPKSQAKQWRGVFAEGGPFAPDLLRVLAAQVDQPYEDLLALYRSAPESAFAAAPRPTRKARTASS